MSREAALFALGAAATLAALRLRGSGAGAAARASAAADADPVPRCEHVPDLRRSARAWRDVRPYHRSRETTLLGSMALRPYKVHFGVNMSDNARVYESEELERRVRSALRRQVDGLAEGVLFEHVTGAILEAGYSVYVYGGFVRDVFASGAEADDIDVLFTIPVRELEKICLAKGWRYTLKLTEGRVRHDFMAVGDKNAKQKFSGHTLDSGCSGEFTANTLLWDLNEAVLIDPTGQGIADAVSRTLRISYDRPDWQRWVDSDRLVGMSSVRFLNFLGRGFQPDDDTREFVTGTLKGLIEAEDPGVEETLRIFFKRKIKKKSRAVAQEKHEVFRRAVEDSIEWLAHRRGEPAVSGADWYDRHLMPIYLDVPGILERGLSRSESQNELLAAASAAASGASSASGAGPA